MSDDLTDAQIALLCDIGEFDPSKQTEEKKRELERLISGGSVELAGAAQLTSSQPKTTSFLASAVAG
jgi:hypothetical protein